MLYNENERIFLKRGGEMACGFSEKCRHYNAWWCDTNHNSCGTAKKFESLFFSIVKRQLKTESSFSVYNFGTFKKSYIEESWGFNPSNGKKLFIPSHTRIKFVRFQKVAQRKKKKTEV